MVLRIENVMVNVGRSAKDGASVGRGRDGEEHCGMAGTQMRAQREKRGVLEASMVYNYIMINY